MSMSAQTTVNLSELSPNPNNPRSAHEPAGIDELAASIVNDGILQNLIVQDDQSGGFIVIAGHRRLHALQQLQKAKRIKADFKVPVRILKADETTALAIALEENLQREDLSPLDEAEAFKRLIALGVKKEDLADRLGKSKRFIEKRIKLAVDLDQEAKVALNKGDIDLAFANVLVTSAGSKKKQKAILQDRKAGAWYTQNSKSLAHHLASGHYPSLRDARFDPDLYDGDIMETEHNILCLDVPQFARLQTAKAEAMVKELEAEGFAQVVLCEGVQEIPEDRFACGYQFAQLPKKKRIAVVVIRPMPDCAIFVDTNCVDAKAYAETLAKQKEREAKAKADERQAAADKPMSAEKLLPSRVGIDLCNEAKTHALRRAAMNGFYSGPLAYLITGLLCEGLWGCRIRGDHAYVTNNWKTDELEARLAELIKPLTDAKLKHHGSRDFIGARRYHDSARVFEIVAEMPEADQIELLAALVAHSIGHFPNEMIGEGSAMVALAKRLQGPELTVKMPIDKAYVETLGKPAAIALHWEIGEMMNVADPETRATAFRRLTLQQMRKQILVDVKNAIEAGNEEMMRYVPHAARFGTRDDIIAECHQTAKTMPAIKRRQVKPKTAAKKAPAKKAVTHKAPAKGK